MSCKGVAGTIVDPRDDGNVQWKIPDNKMMCMMYQNHYYISQAFNFLERSWYFKFYPNGDRIDEKENFFTVYLHVKCTTQANVPLTLNICLNLSLDNFKGDRIEPKMKTATHTFSNYYPTYVWEKILQSSLVWNNKPYSSPITISCFATADSLPMFTFYRSMCRKAKLSEDLKKMYDDKRDCDITFTVGERRFKAHKLILGIRSQRFDKIFKDNPNDDPISFSSCDPDAFETLLQFLYTGTVEKLSLKEVINLYRAANFFCKDLAGICARYMADQMSEDTYKKIRRLAVEYKDKWLKNATDKFHKTNMAMDDADG